MAQVQCTKCGHPFDEKEQSNWGPFTCSYHPRKPRSIGNTGPKGDYAELWYFPCCGKGVVGEIVNGSDKEPLRSPGCMLSPRSIERPEVNRELDAAFRARTPIIPILLEACDIPAQLVSINYIDWREGQDFGYSSNFGLLDEALGDPVRMQLLEQIRQGHAAR